MVVFLIIISVFFTKNCFDEAQIEDEKEDRKELVTKWSEGEENEKNEENLRDRFENRDLFTLN